MLTDRDYTYCGEHCVMCRIAESTCCTVETNITLYVNYTSITTTTKKPTNPFHKGSILMT